MSTNGLTPFPFQKKTVFKAERDFGGRALIANDTGLGKTPTALWTVQRKRIGETYPFLVVLPRVVRQQWIEAIHNILGFYPDILETRTPPKEGTRRIERGAVINYDVTPWWRDWLEDQNFQTLIVDECQYCTNSKAKRTIVVRGLMKEIPYCLCLSATPLTERPMELWAIINALNPKYWYDKNLFAHKYCGPKYTARGWTFKGASNIGELNLRLKQSVMVRYRKQDVLHELPKKVRTIVPVDLRRMEEYRQAEMDFLGWMKGVYPERLKSAVKAAALIKSGHLLRLAAKLKLHSVVEWVNLKLQQHNHEKLIVFGVHKKCIQALKRRINAKSVIVDGSVIGKKREQAVSQFQKDRDTRVMIGNIAAAGIGLNLTQAATLCVAELMYKPGPLLQIEGRIDRIGQEKPTWIYYFIGTGTIEEKVSQLVQRKQKTVSGTLDGDEAEDDFDLYDLLLEELENGSTEGAMLRRPEVDKQGGNKRRVVPATFWNSHNRR